MYKLGAFYLTQPEAYHLRSISSPKYIMTADRLAQLVERRTTVREVEGSSPDRTNTQGLKITEENVLPLYLHLQMVRYSSLLG